MSDTNESAIDLIMRQTNYDASTAREKLMEHQNDVMQVIRGYLNDGKTNKPATIKTSTNQLIYKEIRCMMDDAAKTYLEKRDK